MPVPDHVDLSLIIPALNEAGNLTELLPQVHMRLAPLSIRYEIIVIDEQANGHTRQVVEENQATLICPPTRGFGSALAAGFQRAAGAHIITMDADQSHPPDFLCDLWKARETAEIVIASRYIEGGQAQMPLGRLILSRVLNLAFSRGLDLQAKDMSSGYRLYQARSVKNLAFKSKDFDILQEALVHAFANGYRVREIPFIYKPRRHGSSHARLVKFGLAYLRTFARLWTRRNSVASADYDHRAHDSWIPPQRYWQRQRYRHINELATGVGRCLDVGCGSSRILGALPPRSIGLDIALKKLRFARHHGGPLIQGSAHGLPVAGATFPCVICSQVIEHITRGSVLSELDRVLEPGGLLILGTPDYAKWQWRTTERIYSLLLPNAYGSEHITHYTYSELIGEFVGQRGYSLESVRYILQGELILALRKPSLSTHAQSTLNAIPTTAHA